MLNVKTRGKEKKKGAHDRGDLKRSIKETRRSGVQTIFRSDLNKMTLQRHNLFFIHADYIP